MRVLFALLALAASVATVSAQNWTGPNFYVTGFEGNSSTTFKYNFLINNATVANPSFNLTVGTTYKFILNASMSGHPFGFSTDMTTMVNSTSVTSSGSCLPGANSAFAWYTSDVANPCILSLTHDAVQQGQVYYRCSFHPAMIGTLTPVAAAGSVTTAPPTTPAPSGNSTTAPPTTTPAPTGSSSSTGKGNGAAVLVPGAAAFIIAAINAIVA